MVYSTVIRNLDVTFTTDKRPTRKCAGDRRHATNSGNGIRGAVSLLALSVRGARALRGGFVVIH
jgi:hypothetical protein